MLTSAERTLCSSIGFDESVALLLKEASGKPIEQSQEGDLPGSETAPVAGLASQARDQRERGHIIPLWWG